MTSPHHDVSAVLSRWAAAEQAGDVASLRELLADGFTGVGPLGFTLSKTDWLDRHGPDRLRYDTFDLAETEIGVFGSAADAAVVSARLHSKGSYQGHPTPKALRVSLLLHNDTYWWRLTLAHMSFIAGTPGAPPIPGGAEAGNAA